MTLTAEEQVILRELGRVRTALTTRTKLDREVEGHREAIVTLLESLAPPEVDAIVLYITKPEVAKKLQKLLDFFTEME